MKKKKRERKNEKVEREETKNNEGVVMEESRLKSD